MVCYLVIKALIRRFVKILWIYILNSLNTKFNMVKLLLKFAKSHLSISPTNYYNGWFHF